MREPRNVSAYYVAEMVKNEVNTETLMAFFDKEKAKEKYPSFGRVLDVFGGNIGARAIEVLKVFDVAGMSLEEMTQAIYDGCGLIYYDILEGMHGA